MNTYHEVPTDPTTLAALMADLPSTIDEQPDEIDAPRYRMVSETTTPTGQRVRRYTNRPITKENPTMPKQTNHAAVEDSHLDESPEAIAALVKGQPPRHLTSTDAEAWTEASAEIGGWLNTDGALLLVTTAEKLVSEFRAAAPSTPPALARVKVQQALARLVANTSHRLATVQVGNDIGTDPVAVLMAVPEGTRLAAAGYEAVVVAWYPDGTYDFTDSETGDRVSIPSLYKGSAAGYCRVWRSLTDAVAEFDRLKDANRTLRRLSRPQFLPESLRDDDDDAPPSAAASIV